MNETYENVMDIQWLCYRVLRAWRPIVVWALIIGVVLGIGSAAVKSIKLSDEDFMEAAKLDYSREHASWVATAENLRIQLSNLEKAKNRQLEYNEKSILMEIDPLRKHVASFELYVDYDYQINPALTYQQIDLSGRILKSYATYMTGGEMYQHIIDNLDYDTELRYLDEVLTVELDYENNMISVSVVQATEEKCQQILRLAREGIQSRHSAVCATIDVHTITVNNQSAYEIIDLKLEDTQDANLQAVSDIDIQIQEVNKKLQEWSQSPEPNFGYESDKVIKSGLKMAVIGCIVSVVGIAACVVVCSLLSGKLLNPEDLRGRFGLRLIGKLPQDRVKKPFAFISRQFAKFGGITAKPEDYPALAQMVGSSIRFDIAAREDAGQWKTVAVTGTVPEEKLRQVAEDMAIGGGYTVVCASDVLANAEAVNKVSAADCVVLVEAQEKSVMSAVAKELEALRAWNKPVLGAVVLNTDAVL